MELIELISIRIDEVRSQRGQDITELARRAGIKNKTLWKTLHGNREMKADELVALYYVLKLDSNHFINEKIQEDLDSRCWKAIRDLSTNPHSFESCFPAGCKSIRNGFMSKDSSKQEKRQILPQDYYDSRQVMALLKLSKQKYYELVEREEDPLPMRMFGWLTRGTLAERSELMSWFKRNTRLARDSKKSRKG